jgi:hypothetical protein
VAEDEVAQDPAAERGDHRQDGDADDVEVAADRHQRPGDSEREDADQVEQRVHGGRMTCDGRPRRGAGGGVHYAFSARGCR